MRHLRFYHPQQLPIGHTVQLNDSAAIHVSRVLRLQMGDALTLFNGDGRDYQCQLQLVAKNSVAALVQASQPVNNESPLNIHLMQGISAGDRMDITLQKAVELGVKHIVPIKTTRSVVKLSAERAQKRLTHWQHIIIAACEQCGRAVIPSIAEPVTLADWLHANPINGDLRLTLEPSATQRLASISKPATNIHLLIGAEGGFTPAELGAASAAGFTGVTLGPRILRTETAALAAVAAIHALWGDF